MEVNSQSRGRRVRRRGCDSDEFRVCDEHGWRGKVMMAPSEVVAGGEVSACVVDRVGMGVNEEGGGKPTGGAER
jgi:hypothetical protein